MLGTFFAMVQNELIFRNYMANDPIMDWCKVANLVCTIATIYLLYRYVLELTVFLVASALLPINDERCAMWNTGTIG